MATSDQKQTVLDEMKQKPLRRVTRGALSSLDDGHKPNMIYSSRGGSFVKSRQNRLLKTSSYSSPSNTSNQDQRQVKKARPYSVTEKVSQEWSKSLREKTTSKSTSNLSRNSSASVMTLPMSVASTIRRQSHGDTSTEGFLSRRSSTSSIKSFEKPTYSSSARQTNRPGSTNEKSSSNASRNGSKSNSIKSPAIAHTSNNAGQPQRHAGRPRAGSNEKQPLTSKVLSEKVVSSPPQSISLSSSQKSSRSNSISSRVSTRSDISSSNIPPPITINGDTPFIDHNENNDNELSHQSPRKEIVDFSNKSCEHSEDFTSRIISEKSSPLFHETKVIETSSAVLPETSPSTSDHNDTRITSTTSTNVLDYFNSTLAGYASTSASEMASQSQDPHSDRNLLSPSGESVFSYSHRSASTESDKSNSGCSTTDSESELSSQDENSYDVSKSRRGSGAGLENQQNGLTVAIVSRSNSKRRTKKKKKENRTLKVTKYKGNVKTVRQHIRPGTVGNLTNLFAESSIEDTDISTQRTKRPSLEHQNSDHDRNCQDKLTKSDIDNNKINVQEFDYLSASKAMVEKVKFDRLSSPSLQRRDGGTHKTSDDVKKTMPPEIQVTYNVESSDDAMNTILTNKSVLYSNGGAQNSDQKDLPSYTIERLDYQQSDSQTESRSRLNSSPSREREIDSKLTESSTDLNILTSNKDDRTFQLGHPVNLYGEDNTAIDSQSYLKNIDTESKQPSGEVSIVDLDTNGVLCSDLGLVTKDDPFESTELYHVESMPTSTSDTQSESIITRTGEGGGESLKTLPPESGSRLTSDGHKKEVIQSLPSDTTDSIPLRQTLEESSGRWSREDKIDETPGHKDVVLVLDSVSAQTTGSTRQSPSPSTNLTTWTTRDDIGLQDAMIDHRNNSLLKESASQKGSKEEESHREKYAFEGTNDSYESDIRSSETSTITKGGNASYSYNYTTSKRDTRLGYYSESGLLDSGADAALFITKTEEESRAQGRGDVNTQLMADIPSQTTGVNLFAHTTSVNMERDEDRKEGGVHGDIIDKEEEEDRNNDQDEQKQTAHGRLTVERPAHVGQISTTSTFAQVKINESRSNDETHSIQRGVSSLDDFNSILAGLNLNDSDSNALPSVTEYTNSQENNSFEKGLHESDSMKRKKKEIKSFTHESDNRESTHRNISSGHNTSVDFVEQLKYSDKHISNEASLDDEIRQLHAQLSPRTSDNVVEETTFKLAQNVHSNQSSLSSQSTSHKEQKETRETVFNSDFFTSRQVIEEGYGVEERNEDQDNTNRERTSLSLIRTDQLDISASHEDDRSSGKKVNGGEEAYITPPIFNTGNSDASSSPLRNLDLPVNNREEADAPFSIGGSHTVVVSGINEKKRDRPGSHKDSGSSSESEDSVSNTYEVSERKERDNSLIGDNSPRSHYSDVINKSGILVQDYETHKNVTVNYSDQFEEDRRRRSKSSSSSSESSSSSDSDSDDTLTSTDRVRSKKKEKHKKGAISGSFRDKEVPKRDDGIKRNVFFRQENVRSISNDSEHPGTPVNSFTDVSIETISDKQYDFQSERQNEERDNMAAIVGEVSTFNIHRKVTSSEESTGVPSNRSSTSQIQAVPIDGGGNSDIYFIQDKSGDVFALQEVADATNNTTTAQSVTTIRTVSRDDYNSRATPVQPVSFGGSNYPPDQARTDIYVDSASVNDEKAREVISAYLNSSSNIVGNQSMESSVIRGSSSSYGHSQENTGGAIVVNNTAQPNVFSSPHSIIVHQGVNGNDTLNNSTVIVNEEVNTKTDTSQTWDVHGYEPYTTGSGGEQSHRSSMVVTNLNTPQQHTQYFSSSNQPRNDTSFDSQHSGFVVNAGQSASAFQPLSINVNQNQGVAPFATRPVTIQTTTNAVVGEKVDMTIDFPGGKQQLPKHRVTATAELGTSSSDDESKRRYVVRDAPSKSSMKKGSVYNSSNTSFDSNSDIVYTKKLSGEITIGGKKRPIVFDRSRDMKNTTTRSDSFSPSSANSSTYVMRQDSGRSQRNESLYEKNKSRQSSGSQKGRKVSKSSSKHHSPERFFKNPTFSLSKRNYDAKSVSSDDETQDKQYRTITKVVIDGEDANKSRSASSSPTPRYRLSNQNSFNMDQTDNLSLDGQPYQIVSVKSKKDSGSGSYSEDESEFEISKQRRRYKVVGKSSVDRRDTKTRSSPKSGNVHSTSYEEAVIHRTQRVQPSRYQTLPSSSKSHKTVIQLDVGDQNQIKERSRIENDNDSMKYKMARAKSLDSLHSRSNNVLSNSRTDSQSKTRSWRNARAVSDGTSSDEGSSSDLEGAGPYNLSSSKLVKTSKQRKDGKTFVVNSTVSDKQRHPTGWYKSTIDINEDMPDGNNVSLVKTRNLKDEESFSQSERITEERQNSYKTEEKSVYYVRQESQPASNHVTKFRVHPSPDSGQGTEVASSDGENEIHRQKFERVERIYEVRTEPVLPEQFEDDTEVSKDLRVLRGKILIKNRLDSDHDEDDFDQNVNVFDNSFHMEKDNPLYSSDTDLQASLQREEEEELARRINQDITFEQVNKMKSTRKSQTTGMEVSPKPKRKQNLSTLLLSKLANVDSRDIRQTIDVQHHNEEIFGNIDFIHADGEHTGSQNTSNFDSVSEKVELTLQQGKAFVTIKVIAERIVPTDYEFNVWRKSQAIVTRQIEVDLLANEQRRRFYNHVMDTQGMPASVEYYESNNSRHFDSSLTSQEKQLSSLETLKLFSQILDVADGQGEQDHTSMRTKQEMGQLTGADLLY